MLARLLKSTVDPMRKGRWSMVSGKFMPSNVQTILIKFLFFQINQQINQEHAKIKAIQRTLQDISLDLQTTKFSHKLRSQLSEESNVTKDPAAWFKPDPDIWTPPPKDPDVWGPPKPPAPIQQVGRRATTTGNNRRSNLNSAQSSSGRTSTIPQINTRNGPGAARNSRNSAASSTNSARGGTANGRAGGRKLSTSNSNNNNNNNESKEDDGTATGSNGTTADGEGGEQQAGEEERKFQPNNHIEAELVDILGE